MPRLAPCAHLIPCLALLGSLPGWATPAIDESLESAAQMESVAAPGAIVPEAPVLPAVSAPPPIAAERYGETLAEPGSLEAAVNALPAPRTPARVLLMGSGSVLSGTGAAGLPAGGEGAGAVGEAASEPGLVPADLSSKLGLPAPLEVEAR